MNFQNDRYSLRFAGSGDNEGIRKIFACGGFDGNLSVQYLRDPAPFESFSADGEENRILVIIDNQIGEVVAVGGAVVREEYLNGVPEKCAYLTGLKFRSDYRRRIGFLPEAYQFLRKEISHCKLCYTTILDDNKAVISMLEKRHRNMPEYRYLGHYNTYCFHGAKKLLPIEKGNMSGFSELTQKYFSNISLTPVNYDLRGFGEKTFYSYRENGEIVACCFIGDQRATKQYKMCSYGGVYKLLSKVPTKMLGYPEFPKAGSVIPHGVVSYLYVQDNDKRLCERFLRSAAKDTAFSLLIWGGFENNPLCAALDNMKTIQYGSRLYSVEWDNTVQIGGVIGVEAALL